MTSLHSKLAVRVLVGAITISWGCLTVISIRVSNGNVNAAVFPVPVLACPIISWPSSSKRNRHCLNRSWIDVASCVECFQNRFGQSQLLESNGLLLTECLSSFIFISFADSQESCVTNPKTKMSAHFVVAAEKFQRNQVLRDYSRAY